VFNRRFEAAGKHVSVTSAFTDGKELSMPRRDIGRAVESLVQSVVNEAVQSVKDNLPSQRQLGKIEQKLRILDQRVTSLLRASGKSVRTGRGRVGRPRKNPLVCSARGCTNPARAKALCSRHYQQRRRSQMRKK
jgi:hypothetical protein